MRLWESNRLALTRSPVLGGYGGKFVTTAPLTPEDPEGASLRAGSGKQRYH